MSDGAGRAHDPDVDALVALRRRRYLPLSIGVSTLYALVAIGCAFAPSLMRRPVVGSHISLALVSMVVVILVAIASAGYYTWWSNTVRDPLADRLRRSSLRKSA